ncbi:uncharacterized protein LOC121233113 [Aquila chrysaetos chrysaetos]|uniref:uncharacterized protein LOC121233113 n=1 Tax=Aquila chrysaetos chrysaetos TaxID=223781 RepID=UPI001B7D42AF|nr:uncharacterized protein LOC121233113 [Aquila chrysaetos chrysaetos]
MVGLYMFLLGLVLPQFLMAFAWRSSVSIRGILLPMRRMRALIALCPCVRSQSRPARSEDGGRVTGTVPAAVTTLVAVGTSLLKRLQDHEGDRVETYRELESVLWGDDGCLTSGVVNRLIAEALSDMRAAQGVTGDVKMAASDVLVALARSHFHFVMSELQSQLKAMRKVPDEIVLLTLGKMARRYALRCIPFAGMTLLAPARRADPGGLEMLVSQHQQNSEGFSITVANQTKKKTTKMGISISGRFQKLEGKGGEEEEEEE